jgi:glyceraldehyde 3-phosphate dehydrogenase
MSIIGINGFGRIGKCVFLQLIHNVGLHVKVINAPDFDIHKIEHYLKFDSVHHYDKTFEVKVLDDNAFSINGRITHVLRNRDAKQLNWSSYGINHVIDATGVYLTSEKAKQHSVEYVIMSAPAKDDTPLFVYGANHHTYEGEKIVSGASCTTNCITPVLRHLEENYGIRNANFTTIHASTASQTVVDTAHSNSRTDRSIFNNIIPHTTGASSSIYKVIPSLEGKIIGTSVRVPVNNVSLVDLNVELTESTSLTNILDLMREDPHLRLTNTNLVSSDFISTECPSIIDSTACMHLGDNRYKIMIWYDNEWSYASQVIKLAQMMCSYSQKDPFYIDSHTFMGKNVVLRLDLNVPMQNGVITDDYRITSALPTIRRILKDGPKRLVILTHMGRPTGHELKYSTRVLIPKLEQYLGTSVGFLPDGVSESSLDILQDDKRTVYLMENLRFHGEETEYKTVDADNVVVKTIQLLGDIYVNDAFGCAHRDHLSIKGIHAPERAYGYLIHTELQALNTITKNPHNQKILAIIGGGKMDDKLELLKNLCKKADHIFIAGGNINSLLKHDMTDYLAEIGSHKAKISLMTDGLCASNLEEMPKHISTQESGSHENFFDIGMQSFNNLHKLIAKHDIIFWNGTLGVVEDAKYRKGSELLVNTLMGELKAHPAKKVIVGGGDTAGFVNMFEHGFTHISTGGGAAIEYITFDTLTGLELFQ